MDKFAFGQKWFWVGLVVATISGPAGLVYSVALMVEPERRKEGLALAVWSVVWTSLVLGTIYVLQQEK